MQCWPCCLRSSGRGGMGEALASATCICRLDMQAAGAAGVLMPQENCSSCGANEEMQSPSTCPPANRSGAANAIELLAHAWRPFNR